MGRHPIDRSASKIFGEILIEECNLRKVTNEELANHLKVSTSQCYKYKKGKDRTTLDRFFEISHILNIPPEELFAALVKRLNKDDTS